MAENDLRTIESTIAKLLGDVSRYSGVGMRIECGEISTYDIDEVHDNSVEAFLFETYRSKVREGIAKRRAENEAYENRWKRTNGISALRRWGTCSPSTRPSSGNSWVE